jgi:uncharacterized protein (TIGR02302 family)
MNRAALSRRLRLARLALWGERLAPRLTALASLLAVGLALALFDVAPLLPAALHALVLLGMAVAGGALVVGMVRLPRPTEDEAARRLERDSATPHRPLAVAGDSLATGDAELWRLHQARMEDLAGTLRPSWPDPVMAAKDPHALRFAALLLLVLALAGGGSDWRGRLERAASPPLALPGLGPDALEAWITPPSYTGLAPQVLRPGQDKNKPLAVAEGSTLKAVLAGGWGRASLRLGDQSIPFRDGNDGGQRVEAVLGSGDSLVVRQGWREVASWPVTIIRDALPSIAFAGTPTADERGRLHVTLEGSDDYGLARAWIEIEGPDKPVLNHDIQGTGGGRKSLTLVHRLDMAAHEWAGQPVRLIPHGEDGAGQAAAGDALTVTLPERVFRHPVARALISWRRQVSEAPRLGPEVAERLRGLTDDPDSFGGDRVVFLALAVARRLLAAEAFDRDELRDLLWNAAARLDDGGLPAAEQELDQARSDLERALAEGAPPAALAELVERYRQALAAWLTALSESGQADTGPAGDDAEVIGADDLAEMVEALRDMAASGDRDALARRLGELSSLLAELGRPQPPGSDDGGSAKALREVRELARRQRELLDQSFRKSGPLAEDEDPPPPPARSTAADRAEARRAAKAQKELAEALKRLGGEMGGMPESLEESGRMMAEAADSLGEGDWPVAAEQQGEALRLLRDGARELADRMAVARGQGKGGMMLADPLGRSHHGMRHRDDGSTKVPGQAEARRVREILDEIRRRANDARRPPPELDYLRRVLRQY